MTYIMLNCLWRGDTSRNNRDKHVQGRGTENVIVPLAAGYLELITVWNLEEGQSDPLAKYAGFAISEPAVDLLFRL
jgi:hypothetical protein